MFLVIWQAGQMLRPRHLNQTPRTIPYFFTLVSVQIRLDDSLGLWVHLGTLHLSRLISTLLRTHYSDHLFNVTCEQVGLLLLGGQRTLCGLQTLLLSHLALGGLLGVLAHSALVRIPEVHRLFLGRHEWTLGLNAHLFFLFLQNWGNCFVDALRCRSLIIFILTCLVKNQILVHIVSKLTGSLSFLHLSFLKLEIVTGVLEVGNNPVIDLISPFTASLDSHVLLSRYKLVNDQVLQTNFPR